MIPTTSTATITSMRLKAELVRDPIFRSLNFIYLWQEKSRAEFGHNCQQAQPPSQDTLVKKQDTPFQGLIANRAFFVPLTFPAPYIASGPPNSLEPRQIRGSPRGRLAGDSEPCQLPRLLRTSISSGVSTHFKLVLDLIYNAITVIESSPRRPPFCDNMRCLEDGRWSRCAGLALNPKRKQIIL